MNASGLIFASYTKVIIHFKDLHVISKSCSHTKVLSSDLLRLPVRKKSVVLGAWIVKSRMVGCYPRRRERIRVPFPRLILVEITTIIARVVAASRH